jgi:hypothetical protein
MATHRILLRLFTDSNPSASAGIPQQCAGILSRNGTECKHSMRARCDSAPHGGPVRACSI